MRPQKIQKNRKKRKKKKKKREKGATLLFLLKDPHLCFKVALVLHREFFISFMHNYVGTLTL